MKDKEYTSRAQIASLIKQVNIEFENKVGNMSCCYDPTFQANNFYIEERIYDIVFQERSEEELEDITVIQNNYLNEEKIKSLFIPEITDQFINQLTEKDIECLTEDIESGIHDYILLERLQPMAFNNQEHQIRFELENIERPNKQQFSHEFVMKHTKLEKIIKENSKLEQSVLKQMGSINCIDQCNELFCTLANELLQNEIKDCNCYDSNSKTATFFCLLNHLYGYSGKYETSYYFLFQGNYIESRKITLSEELNCLASHREMNGYVRTLSCISFEYVGMLLSSLGILEQCNEECLNGENNKNKNVSDFKSVYESMVDNDENYENVIDRNFEDGSYQYERQTYEFEEDIVAKQLENSYYIRSSFPYQSCGEFVPYDCLEPILDIIFNCSAQMYEIFYEKVYQLFYLIAIDIIKFVVENDYEGCFELHKFYSLISDYLQSVTILSKGSLYHLLTIIEENKNFPEKIYENVLENLFHPQIFSILALEEELSNGLIAKILLRIKSFFCKSNAEHSPGYYLGLKIENFVAGKNNQVEYNIKEITEYLNNRHFEYETVNLENAVLLKFKISRDYNFITVIPESNEEDTFAIKSIDQFESQIILNKMCHLDYISAIEQLLQMVPQEIINASEDFEQMINKTQEIFKYEEMKLDGTEEHYNDISSKNLFILTTSEEVLLNITSIIIDSRIQWSILNYLEINNLSFNVSYENEIKATVSNYLNEKKLFHYNYCSYEEILQYELNYKECVKTIEMYIVYHVLKFILLFGTLQETYSVCNMCYSYDYIIEEIVLLDLSSGRRKEFADYIMKFLATYQVNSTMQEASTIDNSLNEGFKFCYVIANESVDSAGERLFNMLEQAETAELVEEMDEYGKDIKNLMVKLLQQDGICIDVYIDNHKYETLEYAIAFSLQILDTRMLEALENLPLISYNGVNILEKLHEEEEFTEHFNRYIINTVKVNLEEIKPLTYFKEQREYNIKYDPSNTCFEKYSNINKEKQALIDHLKKTQQEYIFKLFILALLDDVLQLDENTNENRNITVENAFFTIYNCSFYVQKESSFYKQYEELVSMCSVNLLKNSEIECSLKNNTVAFFREFLFYLAETNSDEFMELFINSQFSEFLDILDKKQKQNIDKLFKELQLICQGKNIKNDYVRNEKIKEIFTKLEELFMKLDNTKNYILIDDSISMSEYELFIEENNIVLSEFDETVEVYDPKEESLKNVPTLPQKLQDNTAINHNLYEKSELFSIAPNELKLSEREKITVSVDSENSTSVESNFNEDKAFQQELDEIVLDYDSLLEYSCNKVENVDIRKSQITYSPYKEDFVCSEYKIIDNYIITENDYNELESSLANSDNYYTMLNLLPFDAHKLLCIFNHLPLNTIILPYYLDEQDQSTLAYMLNVYPIIEEKISEKILNVNLLFFDEYSVYVEQESNIEDVMLSKELIKLFAFAEIEIEQLANILNNIPFALGVKAFVPKQQEISSIGINAAESGALIELSCGCIMNANELSTKKTLEQFISASYMCPRCRKNNQWIMQEKNAQPSSLEIQLVNNTLDLELYDLPFDEYNLILLVENNTAIYGYLQTYNYYNEFLNNWI